MDFKRMLIGTAVGAAALYVTGHLIFEVAFADFYTANAGSATGMDRSSTLTWAIVVANVAYATLIARMILGRTTTLSIRGGAWTGALSGFLLWCTVDFVYYGSTNIANLTRTAVDPLLEFIHGGIGGIVIAAVLSKLPGPRSEISG